MELMDFQKNAIKELLSAMNDDKIREIILKSPTGSGKTIMLSHFMSKYTREKSKTVFVWLTPGKGNLEEQSKTKMDKYIHNASTKLLSDVMTNGFEENDFCFINWEKLTKKGNNALKESERTNFLEWVEKALNNGLSFKIIVDESHQNFTEKADSIIQLFHTDKIIRSSATPKKDNKAKLIEIKEEDVIGEGLIKKLLVINENFPQVIKTDNQTYYLLEQAVKKQIEIQSVFVSKDTSINPLIIVQIPNNSTALLETVKKYFKDLNITTENGKLAIWLSDEHKNIESISDNNAEQKVLIMKQAIATGWDCPRAYILVKLRENMDETFEIQTIGRIRRMPEAKHYENHLLDCCYLYTFDEKFVSGVKMALGKGALESKELFLKNEYKNITLISEQRGILTDITTDQRRTRSSINKHFRNTFNLTNDKKKNKEQLASHEFKFSDTIDTYTKSGNISNISESKSVNNLNIITVKEVPNTHKHGQDLRHAIGLIALEINKDYNTTRSIIDCLFFEKIQYQDKLLSLNAKELYSFVLNNVDLLRHNFRNAMATQLQERNIDSLSLKSQKEFKIPHTLNFTYNANSKDQSESEKNVYKGYLFSAEPRSASEKKFENFCEESNAVEWLYKNGDKGGEYFSIVYEDNSGKQKLFYPDYILSVKGETWIVETKGGFDKEGNSEDIDIFSEKKFEALKNYLHTYKLKGGFVRYDTKSEKLCICLNNYTNDINSDDWQLLKNVFH